MSITQIFTDLENNFGKIYLVSNQTHGYYTILPFVETSFLTFLETLFKTIEVDDYEINYKFLMECSMKEKIIGYLHDIFKTNNYTFTINNKLNSSNDFFNQLNQLIINNIINKSLLENFQLFQYGINTDEKLNIKSYLKNDEKIKKNVCLDIREQCYKSTRLEKIEGLLNNNFEQTIETKDNQTILPYNDYEQIGVKHEGTVFPAPEKTILSECMPIQYYSWKADEYNKNPKNFFKCAVLYCISQSIGIVVENENIIFIDYLIKNFKDFELVKTYNKLDKKELNNFKNYFHKRDFESLEVISKKINSFESLFDINNEKKIDNINIEIEGFIRERYQIDNDKKNIMKATIILDTIISELQYFKEDKLKLSKIISSILLNMGLKKKRMADGIYYYGIIHIYPTISEPNLSVEDKFKKLQQEHKLSQDIKRC